jgi:hypothetical protein
VAREEREGPIFQVILDKITPSWSGDWGGLCCCNCLTNISYPLLIGFGFLTQALRFQDPSRDSMISQDHLRGEIAEEGRDLIVAMR